MARLKKKHRLVLMVFGLPILLFIILLIIGLNKRERDSEYYNSIGLKLNGNIESVESLNYGHDFGIVTIDIDYSNLTKYDKRGELSRYFGLIKDGQAYVVFNSIGSVSKGDSIVIDVQRYKVFRNGKLVHENYIDMPSSILAFIPFNEINNKLKFK